MKKIVFSVFIILVSTGFVFSQISLTSQNHSPVAGDNHHFIIANNVAPGEGGANMSWDFSALTKSRELISHMRQSQDVEKANEIENATLVIQEWDNKFVFNVKENRVEQVGLVTCGNAVIKYDQPFVKMNFPMTYGDVREGEFGGVIENGTSSTIIKGYYKLEIDGYGKIKLPGDIEVDNVIRLRTTRSRTYGKCGQSTTITYRWYCEDVRYPLLTIIVHENGAEEKTIQTAYYADLKKDLDKAREEKALKSLLASEEVQLTVFPNPYEDEFSVSYLLEESSNVTIQILNNTGGIVLTKEMGTQDEGQYIYKVDSKTLGMKAGVYYVKLIVNDNVQTQKVVPVK
jgi:hypothetical protein